MDFTPLAYRSIQIGLSGIAVDQYISDWIVGITDITDLCKEIHKQKIEGEINQVTNMLPVEKIYPYHFSHLE